MKDLKLSTVQMDEIQSIINSLVGFDVELSFIDELNLLTSENIINKCSPLLQSMGQYFKVNCFISMKGDSINLKVETYIVFNDNTSKTTTIKEIDFGKKVTETDPNILPVSGIELVNYLNKTIIGLPTNFTQNDIIYIVEQESNDDINIIANSVSSLYPVSEQKDIEELILEKFQ